MNATGRVQITTGENRISWLSPAELISGDLMVLADMPFRSQTPFGWQRIDSIVDRVSTFVRVASPQDANVEWGFFVDGPPLGERDRPTWVIVRDLYVGRHEDEREQEVELPS